MIERLPWLRRRKKTDPEPVSRLPIACGPLSNGEGYWPDSPRKRLIRELVHEKAEVIARREGVDRREFLASACGMALTLQVINLVNRCSSGRSRGDAGPVMGSPAGAGGGAAPDASVARGVDGGVTPSADAATPWVVASDAAASDSDAGFVTPRDAALDPELARCALGMDRDELVIDMQLHTVTPSTAFAGLRGTHPGESADFPWIQRTAGCFRASIASS